MALGLLAKMGYSFSIKHNKTIKIRHNPGLDIKGSPAAPSR